MSASISERFIVTIVPVTTTVFPARISPFLTLLSSVKTPYSRNYAKQESTDISNEDLEQLGVGSLRKAAVDGDEKEGCYIAGQIAGMVNREQTAAEIIEEIMAQTEQVLARAASFIK